MDHCPAFVLIAPGRRVRCLAPAAHVEPMGPTAHTGTVRVTLPDGTETAAMLLWTDADGADAEELDQAD